MSRPIRTTDLHAVTPPVCDKRQRQSLLADIKDVSPGRRTKGTQGVSRFNQRADFRGGGNQTGEFLLAYDMLKPKIPAAMAAETQRHTEAERHRD